jgi:hypothetical protein
MMKKMRLQIVVKAIGLLAVILIFSAQVFADEVTIVGKINDNYQIVTEDGTVYKVADTEMGNEMLNHVSKFVEALGIVTEEEGVKIIKVTSYVLLDEKTET